jgi:anti-anti-sigma factor
MVDSTSEESPPVLCEFYDGTAWFQVVAPDGRLEVRVGGEIDIASLSAQRDVLSCIASRFKVEASPIVVALADVTYLGSNGLALLVRLQQLAEAAEVAFTLRDVPDQVCRLLQITGLGDLGSPRCV